MLDWLIESPNWLKPPPGLGFLGVATVVYFNGYIWPWCWAVGAVLLVAGILMMKKSDGYNF